MCNPKPAPRCSRHAIDNLKKAKARVDEKPSKLNTVLLEKARKEFYTSPAGIKHLNKNAEEATDPATAEQYREDAEHYSELRQRKLDDYKRAQELASKRNDEATKPVTGEDDEGYKMAHKAPRPGDDAVAALHELDSLYGNDLYEHPHYFPAGADDPELVTQLRKAKGNPDAEVTIYRALPTDQSTINDGDWVALSRKYAEEHAQSNGHGKFHIIKATVPASQIWNEGNSLAELGYAGESPTTEVVK